MTTWAAERAGSKDKRLIVLEAFDRALVRETHILQARPDLVWQQLCNRLQWDEGPVPAALAAAFAKRGSRAAQPWQPIRAQ